jgi:phosphoribosyl 1,2-cyclic phosphodiesterase
LRVGVLGSGSAGNSVLVESGATRILVDAGFSARELARRLDTLGRSPESIDAIVITHDHGDHTRGMGVFARRHGTPLYLTRATRIACDRLLTGRETIEHYRPGYPLVLGDLRIEPFITVHDAADPVAVAVVEIETGTRLGIATDLGRPTAQVRHALSGSDFLILEANHDEQMLHTGPYPHAVRRRIASSHGHLSNHAAARFAEELLHPRLTGVLLAHLSRECNTPELAQEVVETRLRAAGFGGLIAVAGQDEPSAVLDVEELRGRSGPPQFTLL